MMKNYFDYRKKATKTLKVMCELYEEIADAPGAYSRSDIVFEALDLAIFQIGSSICPPSCLGVEDFCKWVKENG